jgi:RNA recognition motif-containing protein
MPGVCRQTLTYYRIVEYATRDQAQNAVNSLSNQNLMGRLVYVREVCPYPLS